MSILTCLEVVDRDRQGYLWDSQGHQWYELDSQPLWDKTDSFALVPAIIYPFDGYLNLTKFVVTEMDRLIFEAVRSASFVS